jgi:hypothetical protein
VFVHGSVNTSKRATFARKSAATFAAFRPRKARQSHIDLGSNNSKDTFDMPNNAFPGVAHSPGFPAISVAEVTPDDANDLADISIGLNVSTPGKIRVTTMQGQVTDVTVSPGAVFPIRVSRVWATGTTATGIRALT